jgi:hypothetical protein
VLFVDDMVAGWYESSRAGVPAVQSACSRSVA